MQAKFAAFFCSTVLLVLPLNGYSQQDMGELIKELTTQIKELQKQVARSNARIDELEQRLKDRQDAQAVAVTPVTTQAPQSAPAENRLAENNSKEKDSKPVVTAGDTKGTFKVPGTETSIAIGGFVKLDALFSDTSTGKDSFGNQRVELAEIPVTALQPGENDQITLHAKESRFWFKSFTPSSWGDINTYMEIDFFGDERLYNYTPRLRHAYGTIGNFLAGQTWTTFLNSQALADTLDNNNVGILLSLRQPQVRWTQPFTLAQLPMEGIVALEAPRSYIFDAANNGITKHNSSHYPDIVARLNFLPTWGNLSLAAMARQAQYSPSASDGEQSIWGGGVSLAGKINTYGADNIRFMLDYGNALGRYGPNNFFADAAVDSDSSLQLITTYSGMFAYQHWWNEAWRSTFAYGIAYADQPKFATLANQQAQSFHANLLWSPVTQTTIGLEYIYANRELVNEQNGELQRVQFSTRFNF